MPTLPDAPSRRFKLLDATEVASIFGVPKSTIYEHARTGLLPSVRLGRRVRFREADLEAFITSGGTDLPGGWRAEPRDDAA